jgi:hypothetical protein
MCFFIVVVMDFNICLADLRYFSATKFGGDQEGLRIEITVLFTLRMDAID